MPKPPRIARWLLQRSLPRQAREFSLGDLDEEFVERSSESPARARRWYWRQMRQGLAHSLRRETPPERTSRTALVGQLGAAWQDTRYAARSLRRSPRFVLVAATTLALGIGANAMIYAVVDAVLLRGLPFEDADRLALLRNGYADGRPGAWLVSYPDYEDYTAGTEAFEHLAAWQQQSPALSSDDGTSAHRLNAVDASWNLLPMLGVEPVLGRGFLQEEDSPDSEHRAALLSYRLWQSRFGGENGVLGRTILLDNTPYRVVGVLPRGFTGVSGGFVLPSVPIDVWLAYRASFSGTSVHLRGLTNVNILGSLTDGISLERARAEVTAVSRALDERFPEDRNGIAAQLLDAQDKAVEGIRRSLTLTFGSVSLLLLIACTNVANLLIGRASTRRREVAVRTALGAARLRIVRQLVAESVLLSVAGAVLGAGIAFVGIEVLTATEALEIARLDAVAMDARVFGFLFAVALACGLAFGIGPALFATRQSPGAALRTEGRAVTGHRSSARRGLVVAQVALAVILLVGAGLLLRSLQRVLDVDPGFQPSGVLTARVQLPMGFVSAEWPQAVAFFEQLEDRARALPGVTSVASAYQLPTDSGWNNAFEFDSTVGGSAQPRELAEGESYSARFGPVTPGYFEVSGIPLLRGRTFTPADDAEAPRVVIVNESFVREYFPAGANPIGARLVYGNWWTGGPPEYEIVGVVRDVLFSARTQSSYRATYFPHAQQPVREMTLLVRTEGDPFDLVAPLRAGLAAIDPSLPLDSVSLLSDQLAAHEASRASLASLLVLFATTALALAGIGVYGVMAFLVARRTRELGIRLALGAKQSDVRRLVMSSGLQLTSLGLLVGLTGAYLLGGSLEQLLYDVDPADGATFAAVGAFLGVIPLLASWLPARRATRVDPMTSLRAD